MKKILLRLGDYLFVLRPLILIPAWSLYLLGAAAGKNQAGVAGEPLYLGGPTTFYFGFACLSAILVCAYLINQVFDRETDRRNNKGHYLTRGIFRVRTVVLMSFVAFLVASWCYRAVGEAQRVPLVTALILSLIYSMPPLRLVARPFADLLANAVGYGGVAFIAGYAAYQDSLTTAATLSIPYICFVGATFLFTTILDINGDKASGRITTSVLIGVKSSAVLACLLTACGWIVALVLSLRLYADWYPVLILSVGLLAFIFATVKAVRGEVERFSSNAVQAATVLVTVPALIIRLEYLVLLVPIVIAARFYYRARFGIQYPGPAVSGKDV